MPLPASALTVHGGCNCRAIRYTISIPPQSSRPLHPCHSSSDPNPPVILPHVFTDHCNDCRRSSGSILPSWICATIDQVKVACLPFPTSTSDVKVAKAGDEANVHRGPERAAAEVFTGESADEGEKTSLSFFESSEGNLRSFCSICGTNLTFFDKRQPVILDIMLGTVDREHLESDIVPERHIWMDLGLSWVKRWLERGDGGKEAGIVKHGTDDFSQTK